MRSRITCLLFGIAATLAVSTPGISADALATASDDVEFAKVVAPPATVSKLASGMVFIEGPAAVPTTANPSGRAGLVFSDIPASHLYRWDGQAVSVLIADSDETNGNAFAGATLFSCRHRSHALVATAWPFTDPAVALVDSYHGEPLNSPNDLAIASDGAIWFTDPSYGVGKREKKQDRNRVYRFDPRTRDLRAVLEDCDQPNGICFSPDEKTLYVGDSGKPHHIRAFAVDLAGAVSDGHVFAEISPGVPDGIRCDTEGRLYSSAGDGVQVFATDGRRIGTIAVPESPANLCFGGVDGKTLYITAKTSLYAIPLLVSGAPVPNASP